jgi:DNA polymerase-3 subunit delta'
MLGQAVRHHRVAHAYLFSGPDGVGKKTTALSLAQVLNCQKATGEACLKCSSCRKIEQGQHPDVRLIKPDGQYIKIEFIRRLQQELASKSYEGQVKVRIIDEADKLTLSAANCLLKTLEEPPSNSLLILISAHPYNLLPTVISRCQQLPFKQLPVGDIEQALKERGLSPIQCRLIAFFGQGSLGQALEMDLAQLLSEREKIVEEVINRLPFSEEELLEWAQKLARDAEQIERLLRWLILWYRDLLFILAGKREGLVNADRSADLSRQAAQFSLADLQQKFNAIERTRDYLQRHVNSQLALEVMFLDLNLGYCTRNNYEAAA